MIYVWWFLWILRIKVESAPTIPLIQWSPGCSQYKATEHAYPITKGFRYQTVTNQSVCHPLCSGLTACGGFTTDILEDRCAFYNINNQIIADHLSNRWLQWYIGKVWYSKTCPYDTGAGDVECDSFSDKVYHNQYIASRWEITQTWSSIPLQLSECQAWCTLYTGCRSVTYRQDWFYAYGMCTLYNTTIQALLDAGLDGDVRNSTGTEYSYTTYMRDCRDGVAYIPSGVHTSQPRNVTVTDRTSTSLAIKWDEPYMISGHLLRYMIRSNTSNTVQVNKDIREYKFTALTPFTTCCIEVWAETTDGLGNVAVEMESTEEDVPSAPSKSLSMSVSNTTAAVMWDVPDETNGVITGYRLRWSGHNDPLHGHTEIDSETHNYTITSLNCYTSYLIEIRAKTSAGYGDPARLNVTTLEGVPSAPVDVLALHIGYCSLTLVWDEPEEMRGELLAYYISFNYVNGSDDFVVWPNVTAFTFDNLTTSTLYDFTVTAETGAGVGDTANTSVVTQKYCYRGSDETTPQVIVITVSVVTPIFIGFGVFFFCCCCKNSNIECCSGISCLRRKFLHDNQHDGLAEESSSVSTKSVMKLNSL